MEAISFENFSMKYTDGDFALSDIDLSIGEGDFVVLTGGTGSGKSTLLRQLKREFVAPSYTGSIKVYGKEVSASTAEDTLNVGYVMQFPSEQIVTDNVFHELAFGLENMGLSTDEIRLRVSETAHYFGITSYITRSTRELSGGEMQIVNIASVMAMRPKILLLDEPTSQLDEVTAEKLVSLIYRINRELGTTIIIAEHRLDLLSDFDSMVIMENGRIAYAGKEPRGYDELPIYMRVGEALGEDTRSVVECRSALRRALDNGKIIEPNIDEESESKGDVLLSCTDVWYRYNRDSKDVLKGADLVVRKGEVLSLIGANGAGKSTLLMLMSGTLALQHGRIKTNGQKVIYIPQNYCFGEDTVREEITSAIDAYSRANIGKKPKGSKKSIIVKKSREELTRMSEDYIELFSLEKVLDSSPYEISGGERAKVAILIALLASPDVLLLDEPTKGLDRAGKEVVKGILSNLTALGKGIVLTSHDIEYVAEVSARVATLFDGSILSICTPRTLTRANYFYTTTTSRICRDILDGVVTERELLEAVGYGQKIRL